MAKEYVTATEAARITGFSIRTITQWLADKKIAGAHKVQPPGEVWRWEIPLTSLEGLRRVPAASPADQDHAGLVARISQLEEELRVMRQRLSTAEVKAPPRVPFMPSVTTAPIPVPRSAVNTIRLSEGGMPKGLVSWYQFAEQHHIPAGTVKDAVERGKLPVVRGNWKVANYYVKGALDASGRRAFFQLWGGRPDFARCPECPHDPPKAPVVSEVVQTSAT